MPTQSKSKGEVTFDEVVNMMAEGAPDVADEELFDEENAVKQSFFAFEKVGDQITGVYVDKKVVPNRLKPGINQTFYYIMNPKTFAVTIVAGRYGQPVQTFPGMDQTPLGAYVGFKFESETKATKPGYNATKNIRTYIKKGKNGLPVLYPDMVKRYTGETMEAQPEDHF